MNEVGFPNVQRLLNKTAVELQDFQVMRLWQVKPQLFIRDVMEVTLDLWQEDVVELYRTHQRLGLVASKGPGKTFTLAMLGWHFFITGHEPKIAALSISKDHLKSNLWAELLKWRARVPLLEKSTTGGMEKIELLGKEGYAFIDARSYPKSADETQMASTLAGLHSDHVAFLIDEAGLIPDAILSTADAALSTGESRTKRARLLVTGNPEAPQGMLYRAYKGNSVQKWAIYHVSGDPNDPKRAPRVSSEWAQEQIDTFGADHPWVLVNVFGKYPNVAVDTLLTEDEIDESMKRVIKPEDIRTAQLRLGVDVARGGIDSSALAPRKGLKAYPIEPASSALDGPQLAGKIAYMVEEKRIERVMVDNTGGYGASCIDALKNFPHIDVTPIVYNAAAQNDKIYVNKRAEMYIRLRDWVRAGGALPFDLKLKEELMAQRVLFNGTRMKLEEKEIVKKRIGRSPDRSDALAETFCDPEQPSYYADFSSDEAQYDFHRRLGRYYADESQIDKYHMSNGNYKS